MTLKKNKVAKSHFKYSSSSNSLESYTKLSYASQDSSPSPKAGVDLANQSYDTHDILYNKPPQLAFSDYND